MNRRIYKYKLEVTDRQVLKLPRSSRPLCVQVQYGVPCMWVDQDVDDPKTRLLVVHTIGTGNPIPNDMLGIYLGTYQLDGGTQVYHVYFV